MFYLIFNMTYCCHIPFDIIELSKIKERYKMDMKYVYKEKFSVLGKLGQGAAENPGAG